MQVIPKSLLCQYYTGSMMVWYGMESQPSKFLPISRVDWWGVKREQESTTCYTFTPCVGSFTCPA